MKIEVRFFEAGKWADKPHEPVFDVEAGEVKKVSLELATVVTNAKKGELYVAPKVSPTAEAAAKAEAKAAAEAEAKAAAEVNKNPATKDKKKAQGK